MLNRSSPVGSETSLLSGRLEIERAVKNVVQRGTPPIILESSPVVRFDSRRTNEVNDSDQWERVTQGSMERRAELVDSPSFEGLVGRISWDSRVGSGGEIVLF
jgi:hypothetical protein